MKVRPLKDLGVVDIPAATCPQIDPPSQQLDVGQDGDNDRAMRGLDGHRQLPKKPKEIVVVGSQSFKVETDVNDITSVWWHHLAG